MRREELIQSAEYWKELYEGECYRNKTAPTKVVFFDRKDFTDPDGIVDYVLRYREDQNPNHSQFSGVEVANLIIDFFESKGYPNRFMECYDEDV